MASGPWTFFGKSKQHLMDGSIDLDSDTFRMSLFTSGSNTETNAPSLSVIGGVTGEVAGAFGYATSGKTINGVTWGQGASAGEVRFNGAATVWSATGGNIANIKYAIVWKMGPSAGARKVLFYSKLSASQFTVTTGNSLTVQTAANGFFELN
jgi:hypothetical protein